jgi:hypothetical protein
MCLNIWCNETIFFLKTKGCFTEVAGLSKRVNKWLNEVGVVGLSICTQDRLSSVSQQVCLKNPVHSQNKYAIKDLTLSVQYSSISLITETSRYPLHADRIVSCLAHSCNQCATAGLSSWTGLTSAW